MSIFPIDSFFKKKKKKKNFLFCIEVRCLVTKLCPTLCNPMDCSISGSSVLHHLLEFAQIHVHWVFYCISSAAALFSFCLQSFPASGYFPMSQFFTSGGQSTGVSASASVLPMNIQDWFPLGLTGLTSLQSRQLLRVCSSTTIWSSNSSVLSLLYIQLSHLYKTTREPIQHCKVISLQLE